ncbi:serine hydrolase domain-containing protein [Actinacidiphila sp. ITFR-21]|uniref:serine hydrolase domain-containing protein n=1 Tax=Actinacidiphila sp. ITFR-21 TaxID=3075199 RepID=UPI002889FF2F|nr:serine hydrolase domain-containing protein [Streptomyces sp. ITFR-21]WNI15875.1 serine hydrolase domain-containing protein [Streptomyces sp. ITFR-21]
MDDYEDAGADVGAGASVGVGVGVAVHGTAEDGWEAVRAAFADNFARRGDRGAAVALYRHGRKVVDLWAGTADFDGPAGDRDTGDGDAGTAWTEESVHTVRSAGKGVAAACLLLLHQRGQLDLDAPVGAYWTEFKARGKERVTVRQLLAHRAGVPALDTPLTPEQALDGVSGPRAVAAQAPLFPAGVAHGYHAQTYSWLLGELVLRASGRTIGRFVAEEIARPLGLDLWVGLPPEQTRRVGRIGETAAPPPTASGSLRARPKRAVQDAYADPESLTRRAFAAITPLPDENDPAYRAGELAASNTIADARSLARFYAALIGEVEGGRRLFVPATLTAARTVESEGPDQVLVINTRFGLGYMLHGPASPLLGSGAFGHPGRGGSLAFADPAHGIGFGYVTNGLQQNVTADPRAQALVRAVRQSIG